MFSRLCHTLEVIIKAAGRSVFYRYFVQLEQGSFEELSQKERKGFRFEEGLKKKVKKKKSKKGGIMSFSALKKNLE